MNSLHRSFQQELRATLRPGDMVIWLGEPSAYRYGKRGEFHHFAAGGHAVVRPFGFSYNRAGRRIQKDFVHVAARAIQEVQRWEKDETCLDGAHWHPILLRPADE